MNHSKEWEILRHQGRKYRREKTIMVTIIVSLLIINAILSNIVWCSRHNNENASAAVITQAAEDTPLPSAHEKPRKNVRGICDTGG